MIFEFDCKRKYSQKIVKTFEVFFLAVEAFEETVSAADDTDFSGGDAAEGSSLLLASAVSSYE